MRAVPPYFSAMRALVLALMVATPALAQSPSLQFHGFLSARAIGVKSEPSWLEGGFGKFDVGADARDDRRVREVGEAQVGLDWRPAQWLLVHADGVARHEPSRSGGRGVGVVQAYIDVFNDHWRLRAGSFWLPTSRENIDPLWTSPYTITYSAWNTWIAQEVRPIGVDLQWSPNFYVTAGATAFRGNDTMGTLLAARSWTLGNRLTVYDEPLPALSESTKPIERDLDHRNGYSGRLRVQLPERAMIQVAHVENRAELVPLIDNQEPWHTRFDVVSASVGTTSPTTVSAEYARGWTAVAFPGGSFRMDFATAYLLASHKSGNDRWSARIERFTTDGHDAEPIERGHAVTLAWLHDSGPHVRYGLELVRVNARHPVFPANPGGTTATAEVRYAF